MAEYYFTSIIGTGDGTTDALGNLADPFRPQGTDGLSNWQMFDLRPLGTELGGKCFLAVQVRNDAAHGGRYLGEDLNGATTQPVRNAIGNALGITTTAATYRELLRDILINQARLDGTRWKPLIGTILQLGGTVQL